jgi:diguanylate cyclase (GGDEF)-like protein/PAS domain S-box-containing protein
MRTADGSYRWVEAVATNRLDDPFIDGIVVNARDVTDRREAEEALRLGERDLRTLLEASPDLVARFDREHRHVYVNPAVAAATGVQREHMVGRTMREVGAPESLVEIWDTNLRRAFDTGASGEFEYSFRAPYGLRWFQTRVAPEIGPDGSVESVLAVIRDVTDRKEAEEALTHQALHDPMTGLPNRPLLLDRVSQALRRLERHGGRVALLFLDLDRFKVVNDSLGHAAGDELLVGVSERLQGASRPDDTIARFGGDEFVLLCEDLSSDQDAAVMAERIAKALSPLFMSGDRSFSITASVGIVTTEDPLADAAALLRDADAAMYRAKERGRARYEFFNAALRRRAVARLDIEVGLRRALDRDELRLVYQPVLSLRENRIVGAEALLRWAHPERGLIGPAEFLSVAEETGLIVPIGAWTLHESTALLARWSGSASLPQLPTMMVNLSARQLAQPDLVEYISRALEAAGVEPGHLTVEITEAAVVQNSADAESALQALRRLGVRIALDDFGSGYSSLAYLRRLPVDVVKLHPSLTKWINDDRTDFSIVKAVTAMAHALGHTVAVEGVESAEQLHAARQIGVDQAQGNHCYPPVGASVLLDSAGFSTLAGDALSEKRDA